MSTGALSLSTLVVMHKLNVVEITAEEPVKTLAKVAGSAIPLLLLMYVCRYRVIHMVVSLFLHNKN
jgi:hypothetical protein